MFFFFLKSDNKTIAMPAYFTFVADTVPAYNYTTAQTEPTSPFTRTVNSNSDWEVDAVTYRLKYVGSKSTIYRLSVQFQQTSATTSFRAELTLYDTFPIVNGNGTNTFLVSSNGNLGVMDVIPNGMFFNAIPNHVYGFGIRDRNGAAGTSSDWILTIFLNEVR
jgi:hypothetical protein